MTSERRTVLVVVLMLLGAGGGGLAAGVLTGRPDPRLGPSVPAAPGSSTGPTTPTGAAPTTPTGAGPTTPTGAGPTTAAGPGAIPTAGAGAGAGATAQPAGPAVPVYVLGPTATGPRLYREFRTSPAAGNPAGAAVAGLAVAPGDPDYRSPWLGVPARLSRAGTTATVTFDRAPALAGTSRRLADQQVVYTVTAADPRIRTVRVVAPRLPAAGPAARAAGPAVLAPVWLLDPVDGGTAGSRLTVSGTASVSAATVGVEVRRGAQVLARASATASRGTPGRGDWSATVSVPPGSYVVAAFERSEQGGGEIAVDTKRVTVSGR